MTISGELFFQEADAALHRIVTEQMPVIREAARIMARVIASDGVIHVFGTGHSRAFSMELSGRAGGLVPINKMALTDLTLLGDWPPHRLLDPMLERDLTVAWEIWSLHRIESSDGFIIASNSGANGSTVEMARLAKERKLPVIAVTSMTHSSQVESRHPSGKRLFELANVVIDNGAPYGDALLEMPNGVKLSALSTVTSAMIGEMLVAETARFLLEGGHEVPVLISVNVPGGDEHNRALKEHYAGRVVEGT